MAVGKEGSVSFRAHLAALVAAAVAVIAVAGAAPAAQPAKVSQFVLQNGLQVVVVPDHRSPVVTQMVVYKVGAADDPPGLSGLAHFFEHMMFRGTRTVPGGNFSQTVARNGGNDNAFTTHDYTVFYEQIARERLRLVSHLEADRMANLDLSDSAVFAERDVIGEERRLRIDNDPRALAEEQADAALYLTHPYARPVIGWPEEIRRIGRAEAEDFYRRHYAPNNAILIVAGDVSPEDARAAVEAEFGPLPARELVARVDYAQPRRIGETHLVVQRRGVRVPMFLRVYRVKSYAEAAPGEAEAIDVLARFLGGDSTSALYHRLVAERKVASDVSVDYSGYARDAGEISIMVQPRPGVTLDAVERAVDEILAAAARRPPGKTELMRAKAQLVAGATFRRDDQLQMALAYARALAIGLTVYDVQQWPARVGAVKAGDVRQAAADSLNRNEAVTVMLLPKP